MLFGTLLNATFELCHCTFYNLHIFHIGCDSSSLVCEDANELNKETERKRERGVSTFVDVPWRQAHCFLMRIQ